MIEFDQDFKSITAADIRNAESLIGTKLPQDYVKHMLKYNGGSVPPIECDYIYREKDRDLRFTGFMPIKYGYGTNDEDGTVEKFHKLHHPLWHPKLLVIGAMDNGVISMGIVKENYGQIFHNYSDEEPYKLCDTFTELIENIEDEPWEYD